MKWVPLSQIGSAANWVSFHLVTVLALHQHFIQADRPVPRLLMIDQPSQAWFPSPADWEHRTTKSDDEIQSVEQVYSLLHAFAEEHALQIVATDHAVLPAKWFRKALREDWHDTRNIIDSERALIPLHWIESE